MERKTKDLWELLDLMDDDAVERTVDEETILAELIRRSKPVSGPYWCIGRSAHSQTATWRRIPNLAG
jgi:hypothetical protein